MRGVEGRTEEPRSGGGGRGAEDNQILLNSLLSFNTKEKITLIAFILLEEREKKITRANLMQFSFI